MRSGAASVERSESVTPGADSDERSSSYAVSWRCVNLRGGQHPFALMTLASSKWHFLIFALAIALALGIPGQAASAPPGFALAPVTPPRPLPGPGRHRAQGFRPVGRSQKAGDYLGGT